MNNPKCKIRIWCHHQSYYHIISSTYMTYIQEKTCILTRLYWNWNYWSKYFDLNERTWCHKASFLWYASLSVYTWQRTYSASHLLIFFVHLSDNTLHTLHYSDSKNSISLLTYMTSWCPQKAFPKSSWLGNLRKELSSFRNTFLNNFIIFVMSSEKDCLKFDLTC